ncbi:MAG: DUF1127 domain-containing protein [Mesorhizobium sp.]|nr:DUF1127 domain-containing protein [Mesorhizobium sp.]
MTTLDRTAFPMTGAARPAFAVRIARNLVAAYKAWKNRRAVYQLGLLSEWELSDIGLTRADLHVAWRLPLGVDPTVELGAMAEARSTRELRATAERAAAERAARSVC